MSESDFTTCDHCRGRGWISDDGRKSDCPLCGGSGKLQIVADGGRPEYVMVVQTEAGERIECDTVTPEGNSLRVQSKHVTELVDLEELSSIILERAGRVAATEQTARLVADGRGQNE